MKTLRLFIVRQFALGHIIKIFKLEISILRAARIMFPYFLLSAIFIKNVTPDVFNWYDWVLLSLWILQLWIGFSWFGLGYFELWPIKWKELDEEQKLQYGFLNYDKLSYYEKNEYKLISKKYLNK